MSPHYIVSKEAASAALDGDLPGLKAYLDDNLHLVNQPTIFQSRLLHLACKMGHTHVVHYLLNLGADVGALDYGTPPLLHPSHTPLMALPFPQPSKACKRSCLTTQMPCSCGRNAA